MSKKIDNEETVEKVEEVEVLEEVEEMEKEGLFSKLGKGLKKYGKIVVAVGATLAVGGVAYSLGKKSGEKHSSDTDDDFEDYYYLDEQDNQNVALLESNEK